MATVKGYSERKQAIREAKRKAPAPHRVVLCPDKSVEIHELGAFSMSCYYCHMHADS